ncbi:methyltransferase [Actinocorallia sp. API 0066]|uniref:HemK2/MTQ2 family protein methyltransferase n=1 Tax=Actinocorallia sp. API 0066 TaxID=2896846 RepID=UPI001E36D770|nr:HemK2/MTQ2 family protein methyltransferase [Actinocorallia sp. API 0066]MCD0449156.1 methyltransferase [Actinocorallia sp. API 0066]
MRLLRLPGVYRPRRDTWVLCRALREAKVPQGARVLDLCTGTGQVAVVAARCGAARVTAVDVSWRAVACAAVNGLVRRLRVKARKGDLFTPVAGQRFDVITVNPPYVPRAHGGPRRHGRERAWDAGRDGRDLVDRVCAEAPGMLAPGGVLLMVHSDLCGVPRTLSALREGGLRAEVVTRERDPFGPVMRPRAADFAALGLIAPGRAHDELVVIRAERR